VPDSIGPLIVRRLQQLSPGAYRLAQLAALAGPNFTVSLATRVLGVQALDLSAVWRELEAAQVLCEGALAHDLIAKATSKSIPAPIARQLHKELAAAAETLGALPAHVAQHWFEAGEWAPAGAAFMRAADVARAASQRKLEGELAGQAADCFGRCGDISSRFIARERQHSTTRYTLRLDLQIESARQLLELASTPIQRGVALEAYAAVLVEDFRHDEVAAAAHEARLIAANSGETVCELTAARTESRALGWAKRGQEALQLVQQYLPLAREHLGEESGVRAIAEFGCTLMTCDRFDEAAALFENALQAAVALEDWGLCQECHRHMAWVHDYRGDIEKSAQSYEASESLAQRLGAEKVPASISRSIFARRYKELGRFAQALTLLEEVCDEQRSSQGVAVLAVTEADLAGLYLWLGQPARAMSVLRAPLGDAPPFMHRTYHFAAAQIETWQGRRPVAQLQEALNWAARESGPLYQCMIECEMARILPAAEGAELALQSMARSQAIGLELSTWPLKAVASDALRRARRLDDALELAHQCVAHFETRPPFMLYPPEYWWIAHQIFAAASDGPAADRALGKGVNWIRQIALPQVPAPFLDSFLQRNPVNRALLTTAGRL
jgi:tetratricopeptide (TPR) repeat protein